LIEGKIKIFIEPKKEVTWDIKAAVAVDLTEDHGKCTRRHAQIVRRNAKSLSSPVETVRYIAGTALQNARTKDAKSK
jgi:hypothetical protein